MNKEGEERKIEVIEVEVRIMIGKVKRRIGGEDGVIEKEKEKGRMIKKIIMIWVGGKEEF